MVCCEAFGNPANIVKLLPIYYNILCVYVYLFT